MFLLQLYKAYHYFNCQQINLAHLLITKYSDEMAQQGEIDEEDTINDVEMLRSIIKHQRKIISNLKQKRRRHKMASR